MKWLYVFLRITVKNSEDDECHSTACATFGPAKELELNLYYMSLVEAVGNRGMSVGHVISTVSPGPYDNYQEFCDPAKFINDCFAEAAEILRLFELGELKFVDITDKLK